MRLVFDLFPCQTASRFRGIGRFTQALAEAMMRSRAHHDVYALANGLYPNSADALRQDLAPLLPPAHFATYKHAPIAGFDADHATDTAVAATLVHHAYQALAPDAILYSSPFEGWQEPGLTALPQGALPSALRVAVLYDFIPCLFPDRYLDSPVLKKWYEQRLAALTQFDVLLAISEATRQDAINILRLPPERIINISEAAGAQFRPLPRAACSNIGRFGIVRPFVLYTGNADYRKNQDGMLRAYAALPRALRQTHQLVLNQAGDATAFRQRLQVLGLHEEEVVVTGHITDADLISLYNLCKVFVFPSLYEGFGLPVLEAMACGAPVIAANNSSIPEVMGRSDVLFDATNQAAITAALHKALTDDAWREELARYGVERAKAFTWEQTAQRAWRAIEAGLAAQDTRPLQHAPGSKPRIALVCPLSQHDTPIMRHCATLLPLLTPHFEIDWFAEEGTAAPASTLPPAVAVYPHTQLAARRQQYATVVYQLANHADHAYLLPLTEQFPGVIVLHDAALAAPVKALAERPGMAAVLPHEILYCHGLQGLIAHLQHADRAPALPVNRRVLEAADRLLVADAVHLDLLQQANPGAWLPPMALLPADPAACSVAYRHVIHAAMTASSHHAIRNLADALADTAPTEVALDAIAGHAAGNWRLRKQPRLLIDVTQLARSDLGSGIQRVVRNIAYEITHLADMRRPVELVQQRDGRLWRAGSVIASIFEVPADAVPQQEVLAQPGDTLLMLDSSWEQYDEFLPVFQAVRQLGGKIVTVVYDLIPLHLPQTCIPNLVKVFRVWFPLAVAHSDALLCISRSVADEVRAYLAEHDLQPPRPMDILHWPLGADLAVRADAAAVRPSVLQMTADERSPLFLMVGTLEPRKGHALALDAFEHLWCNGADIRLCIAGAVGWIAPETLERIRQHPQLNRQLFFVEKFTDAEIKLCYAAATALIAASAAEGFGLPIVEAALHRVPTLASDIPVFREVGGDGACYFEPDNPHHLADAIAALAAMPRQQRLDMAARIPVVTWQHSARQLLQTIGISI